MTPLLLLLQAAAAGAAAGGGPKKRLEDAVGWIKGLGAAATNIVGSSSRATDTAEDPEYIKVGCRLLQVTTGSVAMQDYNAVYNAANIAEEHSSGGPRVHQGGIEMLSNEGCRGVSALQVQSLYFYMSRSPS